MAVLHWTVTTLCLVSNHISRTMQQTLRAQPTHVWGQFLLLFALALLPTGIGTTVFQRVAQLPGFAALKVRLEIGQKELSDFNLQESHNLQVTTPFKPHGIIFSTFLLFTDYYSRPKRKFIQNQIIVQFSNCVVQRNFQSNHFKTSLFLYMLVYFRSFHILG